MNLYMCIAVLLAISAITLRLLHMKCTSLGTDNLDINEIDKRYQVDTLTWMTIFESLVVLAMSKSRYRNIGVYCLIYTVFERLRSKGFFDTCVPEKQCPVESNTSFDFTDVCGTTQDLKFEQVHYWSDPYHLCPVPNFYNDCITRKEEEEANGSPAINIHLKDTPSRYLCYVWGCSREITPIRFFLKWQTLILCVLAMMLAASDWLKVKQKNQ